MSEALPQELSWGEVLVSLRAAPINPCDICNLQTGVYGEDAVHAPFVPGMDGVGIVMKVGLQLFQQQQYGMSKAASSQTYQSQQAASCTVHDAMLDRPDLLKLDHVAA